MITSVVNDQGYPVEIAPGRGDLRQGSVPFVNSLRRTLPLINRQVSFANLYREQAMVAATAGWLIRQAMRVPLKAYRRTGDDSRERLRPSEHKLAAAIEEPWERATRIQLVSALLGPVLVHGNAVAELESGAKETLRFLPVDWRYAVPMMPWRDSIVGWDLDIDHPTTKRTRGADVVLHIASWSPLGPLGISPLEQLGVTIAIEDAAQRHQRAMLSNGARPPSAITSTAEFLGLGADERKELLDTLREDIQDIYSGPENSGRPALLPPGLDWKAVGHTAVEAQLLEQRDVNRTEACAIYGLPPSAISVIQRGGELPEQRQMAYTDGLAPPLLMVESALNGQVVSGLLKEDDVFCEFDFSGILRGDRLKEIQALREAISIALMSPKEGRKVLNLPTDGLPEEMGNFFMPRNNLIPLDIPYSAKGNAVGENEAADTSGESDVPAPAEETADPSPAN